MKKLSLLLLTLTVCFFTACHKDIWAELENLDQRVTKLEELCKEMNTNITSLQTIVSVLQSNDFITGIVEIKKNGEVIGYTITFGKHDPITIYHGQDGKDGADGKDGQNGSANAPVIGVAQDIDGVYYWTLNGEWLLDDNGNKLPVSGKDGQNGSNGTMPQLKIEEGYWYVSYDNGATWTELGKAIGEDGQDGEKGDKGDTGDSMFQSVTQDENYVYFTLADGTVIKIAKGSGSGQSNDEFIFTITYDPNGGEGVMEKDTFYYGQSKAISACEYKKAGFYCKGWNTNANGSGAFYEQSSSIVIDKNIILYAQWERQSYYFSVGTGSRVTFSSGNLQYTHSTDKWSFADQQYDVIAIDSVMTDKIDRFPTFEDWGQYVINEYPSNTWRTLSRSEWDYLYNKRSNASNLIVGAEINGTDGLVVLPDNWENNSSIQFVVGTATGQKFSTEEWELLEFMGAVFIPSGSYWHAITDGFCYVAIGSNGISFRLKPAPGSSPSGRVRLVKNVE